MPQARMIGLISQIMIIYIGYIAHYREALPAQWICHHKSRDHQYLQEFAGDILLSMNKIDEAIASYEQALAGHEAPLIEFGLGRAYLARADQGTASDYQNAVNAFSRAVKGEARWPGLQRQLAIALGRNGQLAG